jgi:hypothetical protein
MPQLITDGELVKKTVKTTLVMLGSTALWVGGLTAAVLFSTSPPGAGATSKVDKTPAASAAPGIGAPVTVPAGSKAHRSGLGGVRTPGPAPSGDPI